MNCYCIIIPSFTGLGGAQLYALRRAKYLNDNGYEVTFLVSEYNPEILTIPEYVKVVSFSNLNKPIFFASKESKIIFFQQVKTYFCKIENLVIESFSWEPSTWGEIMAYELKAKHFIYSLGEPNLYPVRYRYVLEYVIFKLKRKEFIGLSSNSLKIILGKYFLSEFNNYVNISFDTNELAEITSPQFLEQCLTDSFIIGTVSRLSKPYIDELIYSTIRLSVANSLKVFNLIICGDSTLKGYTAEDYKVRFLNNPEIKIPKNLKIIFPGYTHPLGKDLFKKLNVFVGMGTAVINSISQGCPTIVVDPRVNLSIGILGVDTDNFAYSWNKKFYLIEDTISKLMNDVELVNNARINGLSLFFNEYDQNICMKKLDNYIHTENLNKQYYSFDNRSVIKVIQISTLWLTGFLNKSKTLFKIYSMFHKIKENV